MAELTRRERFVAALNHEEPDRVPIAFGGPACSIHKDAHDRLLRHLVGEPTGSAPLIDNILQIVAPDERLFEALDVDVLFLVPREGPVRWSGDGQSYVDEFGRSFVYGGGFYNQTGHPLAEGSLAELASYRFPDMREHNRAGGLRERGQKFYAGGYGLAADGAWGVYEISSSLRGTDRLFMDMILNPDYVETLADRVLEEHLIPYYTMMLARTSDLVQMVVISDDYGSQEKLLFSPRAFRRFYKPRLRRLVEHIRSLTDARIYIHSDGALRDLLPEFVEIGIDGINPVQYTAAGMEPAGLKADFGRDLGFFGGAIDNEVLSFGTPDEVRRDVERQVSALGPGGGYVFATIHNIPPEVPPANIVACFEAGRAFGRYPLGST